MMSFIFTITCSFCLWLDSMFSETLQGCSDEIHAMCGVLEKWQTVKKTPLRLVETSKEAEGFLEAEMNHLNVSLSAERTCCILCLKFPPL